MSNHAVFAFELAGAAQRAEDVIAGRPGAVMQPGDLETLVAVARGQVHAVERIQRLRVEMASAPKWSVIDRALAETIRELEGRP